MSILVLTSDTLIGTPATGNLEYNGQFYGTDSNASRAQMQRIALGTTVATTSGTSIDFTGIPSWVKRITVMFSGVSTSGASNWLIRIGDGSIVATGYSAASSYWSAGVGTTLDTTGFPMYQQQASGTHYGAVSIFSFGSNTWVASGVLGGSNGTGFSCTGTKTLVGTLDRIRLTTVNGTDTFDAGSVNLLWEG